MSIKDHKINDEMIADNGVASAPDTLTGTAAENKAVFDRLARVIAQEMNALIDMLAGSAGAAEIGASPFEGVIGESVQAQLASLQANLLAADDAVRAYITEPSGAARIGAAAFDGVQAGNVQAALQEIQKNLTAYGDLLASVSGAGLVGVTPFPGVVAQTLQAALQELQQQINDVTAGVIPDFGVTTNKLALQAVTSSRLAQDVVDMIEAVSPARASSDADDYAIETGEFENAGAGWNTFRFREAFESTPVVTVMPVEFAGIVEVKSIARDGFLYCLRAPEGAGGTVGKVTTATVYTGAGTGTSTDHSARTVVTAVTLPKTTTTAAKIKINYIAIEYGGDR